jgi:hypothetical protein
VILADVLAVESQGVRNNMAVVWDGSTSRRSEAAGGA